MARCAQRSYTPRDHRPARKAARVSEHGKASHKHLGRRRDRLGGVITGSSLRCRSWVDGPRQNGARIVEPPAGRWTAKQRCQSFLTDLLRHTQQIPQGLVKASYAVSPTLIRWHGSAALACVLSVAPLGSVMAIQLHAREWLSSESWLTWGCLR